MKRGEYYRGRNGRKYGIWNTSKKCFQFGIAEDTPMLAEANGHGCDLCYSDYQG